MASKKDSSIEDIKYYVSSLISEEQKSHAQLLADLKNKIGQTNEYKNVESILVQIYESKRELLEKIFLKLQDI